MLYIFRYRNQISRQQWLKENLLSNYIYICQKLVYECENWIILLKYSIVLGTDSKCLIIHWEIMKKFNNFRYCKTVNKFCTSFCSSFAYIPYCNMPFGLCSMWPQLDPCKLQIKVSSKLPMCITDISRF